MFWMMLYFFTPFYAAETWTLELADERRLLAFEMRCYRRIMNICWKDKVTNAAAKDIKERKKTPVVWSHIPDTR